MNIEQGMDYFEAAKRLPRAKDMEMEVDVGDINDSDDDDMESFLESQTEKAKTMTIEELFAIGRTIYAYRGPTGGEHGATLLTAYLKSKCPGTLIDIATLVEASSDDEKGISCYLVTAPLGAIRTIKLVPEKEADGWCVWDRADGSAISALLPCYARRCARQRRRPLRSLLQDPPVGLKAACERW